MVARALMVQGTGSDVGKSLIVAALARVFTRRGIRVRPFKAQNMSNNAAVTKDGGEIGRAQWLQALACNAEPSVHMNPVLLKPESDIACQIVVQGRVQGRALAGEYQHHKASLLPSVLESYAKLRQDAELVLVEGAGSPAEINLREGDIANMGFAEAADCPVVIVGDIDRGGVIASLVGTHRVLSPADKKRIRGFIINKFRGDVRLFDDALDFIADKTDWPALGVIPFAREARMLPQEDAVVLEGDTAMKDAAIHIAVPLLPRIANFDDLDPLRMEPDVTLHFIPPGEPLPARADAVILPGSKATIADLNFFRAEGWDIDLKAHIRRGGKVLGICGGYQMLGLTLSDPDGAESNLREARGLELLEIHTRFTSPKTTRSWSGRTPQGAETLSGYEIHTGISDGPGRNKPLFISGGQPEGAVSENGRIMGTYVHGLFANDSFRHEFLSKLRRRANSGLVYRDTLQTLLDSWADAVEQHVDCERLLAMAQ